MSEAVRTVSAATTKSPLIVAKDAVEVELRDIRGRVRKVQLFLAAWQTAEEHRERLQDLLHSRRFLPLKMPSRFELVSRDHVVWVRQDLLTAFEELDLEAESNVDSVTATVRLELDDGSELEGDLRYLLPPGARRVADYLENLPDPFPLRTADHVYLVRRDRVLAVVPLEEAKR